MTKLEEVEAVERAFQVRLPGDYREFLIGHYEDLLEEGLECDMEHIVGVGSRALIDGLHTAGQILDNERRNASCDAEQSMLIIGYSFFGGYLYLNYSQERLGEVHFRAPYCSSTYGYLAKSFSEFLKKCIPVSGDKA